MSYSLTDAFSKLAQADPRFEVLHRRMAGEWEPESPPSTVLMGAFAEQFVAVPLDVTACTRTLALLEDLLQNGDQEVKNAVATGFWEGVLAEASAGRFDFTLISSRIGPASKAYCKAWDAFTGVRTAGLED